MLQTILVTTPLKVSFKIAHDPSGIYYGHVVQYPGVISQGRTPASVRAKLIRILREIGRSHPEELRLFE
ncbi:MAG: hypothetical protein HYY06_31740 [Deltaproteobacteria bacterium]|nr:hypothetical protein [Deltaproteobacteria bacterium]